MVAAPWDLYGGVEATVEIGHEREEVKSILLLDSPSDLGRVRGYVPEGAKHALDQIRKPCLLKHMDIVKIGTHELCFIDEKAMDFESTRILIRDDGN